MPPVHLARPVGRTGGSVAGLARAAAAGRRHAIDQQRRRRQQRGDARAEPTESCIRPRHARRTRAPGAAGPACRDDHHARWHGAFALRRRSAHLRRQRRADRHRRRDGRTRHRDHRGDHGRGTRDGDVRADRDHTGDEPTRAALRGVGTLSSAASIRTASNGPRHVSSNCSARRARRWWCTPAWSTNAIPRCRRATDRPRCACRR